MKNINDFSNHIPSHCKSPMVMTEPNEPIHIYSGKFNLKNEDLECTLEGKIEFGWLPSMNVSFSGILIEEGQDDKQINPFLKYSLSIEGNNCGEVFIQNFQFSEKKYLSGAGFNFHFGESKIEVNEVIFAIPNFRDFFGEAINYVSDTGEVTTKGKRLTLEDSQYKIVIDQVPGYDQLQKKLAKTTGYLLLYAGKITKNKGSISLSSLKDWHDRLHHFLYFLNGSRVAPMFYTGVHDGEKIWTDYSAYNVDMYKYVTSWSDILNTISINQLWIAFNKLWKDEMDKDFLKTVIHWYISANSGEGGVEGSIILIQTALELIYNWLIVEKEKVIIGNDAEGLSAANKIRIIIHQLKVKPEIPTEFKELSEIPNVQDGPEVFVKIRNALVHGQENKRAEIAKMNLNAKYQALQLGIWYVELSLLYIFKYDGRYRNRTVRKFHAEIGTYLPWTTR